MALNERRLLHGGSLLEQCRSNCRATPSDAVLVTTQRAGPKYSPTVLIFAHVEQPHHAHIALDYRDIVVRATQEAKAELEKILVSGRGYQISANRP